MLDEKKRIDVGNMRIAGCLNQGGKIVLPSDEDDNELIAGIDYPVNEGSMGF